MGESCHKHKAEDPPGLFQNGDAVFQAHHVGWIICGSFTAVAMVASLWLINKHLQWYTNKREQRYIVRLLFLVPIYALISFASFLFWNNATPLILIRDAYEAIVLTAFFYLLLVYLSPDPEEQRHIFLKAGLSKANDIARTQKGEKLQKWMFPLGFIKKKPKDGLYFLQLMKWGVLQYCVIRPVTALASVILDYAGYYCESSWSPVYAHVWIVVIISISVTIAMYCLLQLYMPVSKELKPHRPILKLFSVKAVVFLTFWQATLLAALSMLRVVKGTRYMTAEDINIGIGAILECFEMMIFAFVHITAFTYKPYRPFYDPKSKDPPPSRTPRFRSLGHALDFRETLREIWVGTVYMFDKFRGREPRHDFGARRHAHYEEAFGQTRPAQTVKPAGSKNGKLPAGKTGKDDPKASPASEIAINRDVEVDVSGERQWLGLGDDYGYGLGYFRRERSDALSVQIEKELQIRGITSEGLPTHVAEMSSRQQDEKPPSHRGDRSWWRNVYDRISQSAPHHSKGATDQSLTPSLPRRLQGKSKSRRASAAQRTLLQEDTDPIDLEEHQLGSRIEPLPSSHQFPPSEHDTTSDADVLAPLDAYRERRRSYRPKQHRRNRSSQGSASALLSNASPPTSPVSLSPPLPRTALLDSPMDYKPPNIIFSSSPPESSIDMVELTPRLPLHHDPNSLLSIPTPSSNYGRDSVLNRIFPPSEVGSIDGRYTDSAYSLPSISTEVGRPSPTGPTGDRRLHVHENIIHPTPSSQGLHQAWSANVHYRPESLAGTSIQGSEEDYGPPPPLPAKDVNYVPSFVGRPSRRQLVPRQQKKEHPRHRPPVDSAASLPSLPEDHSFELGAPHPPFGISRIDTGRSSTLVDSLSAPQSVHLSEHDRLSSGDPRDLNPSTIYDEAERLKRREKDLLPSASSSRPESVDSSSPFPHTGSWHRRERAEKRLPMAYYDSGDEQDPGSATPPAPAQRSQPQHQPRYPPRSRPPVDSSLSDDLSDSVSVNTFYTAASRPRSTTAVHRRLL